MMKKLMIILGMMVILTSKNVKCQADVISGERVLGGFSYILDCFYSNRELSPKYEELLSLYNEREPIQKTYLESRDYDILCRIVEAEATGGTIEQKRNVASCVLARVYSPNWPNTVEDVVFQKKQFSPIDDGRYYTVKITDSTIEAVDLTLQEGLTHNCIYFCTPTCKSYKSGWHHTLEEVFQDGIHAYFKGE